MRAGRCILSFTVVPSHACAERRVPYVRTFRTGAFGTGPKTPSMKPPVSVEGTASKSLYLFELSLPHFPRIGGSQEVISITLI